jgi:hypothetical protein
MALISFFAGAGEINQIFDLAGSGLGFYGPGGFGASVQVGQYQDNTYITDPTGAIAGPKADNIKWMASTSGMIPTNDIRVLRDIPNQRASLNIRFTHTAAVKTQNIVVRIFDRNNIDAPASGVTTMVAELVHPWATQAPAGSGSTQWYRLGGSGGVINGVTYDAPLALLNSPGASGFSPNGVNTVNVQHDWYLALSASPDSIGSKTAYGLYISLEYL